MSGQELLVPLDMEERERLRDAEGAAMGRAAHRDLTVLRRMGRLLAAISAILALGTAAHFARGRRAAARPLFLSAALRRAEEMRVRQLRQAYYGAAQKRMPARRRSRAPPRGGW